MKDNHELKIVTIKKYLKALEEDFLSLEEGIKDEDLEYSISRLEDVMSRYGNKAKLVSIEDLNVYRTKGYSIQEGYWYINDLAHYIAVKI